MEDNKKYSFPELKNMHYLELLCLANNIKDLKNNSEHNKSYYAAIIKEMKKIRGK